MLFSCFGCLCTSKRVTHLEEQEMPKNAYPLIDNFTSIEGETSSERSSSYSEERRSPSTSAEFMSPHEYVELEALLKAESKRPKSELSDKSMLKIALIADRLIQAAMIGMTKKTII